MKSFFKTFFAALLGNLVAFSVLAGLALFSLLFFIGLMAGLSDSSANIKVPRQSFLVLDLSVSINDSPQTQGVEALLSGGGASRIALWDVLRALDAAAQDRRVAGLFITGSLTSENYGSGLAALSEVRRSIQQFKTSGKPVLAYLENPSQKDYYLATAADEIHLHPYGSLPLRGLASESPYFGDAFRKYGIGVQTTKVGKFKSAVEPFIQGKMSDPAREQARVLLGSLWGRTLEDIGAARQLSPGALQAIADTQGMLNAEAARRHRLVDSVSYLDEMIGLLKTRGAEDKDNGTFAQVNIRDYISAQPKEGRGPQIAIVYAEGDIVDGPGGPDMVGGDGLAALLRGLRQDDEVAGVVLRVNSPGGSAFASEQIQREARLFRESGKPVVVSMGSLAASGGYWISAYADKIFAEKNTITGSIGVFGLMFNVEEVSRNLGVNFDGVQTAKLAGMESFSRPKNTEELAVLQTLTDDIYTAFLDKVAEGRNLPRADVEKIAEGRVWPGATALELGLVDAEGGLRDAVAEVVARAGVGSRFQVKQHPEARDAWTVLLEGMGSPENSPPIARLPGNGPGARIARQLQDAWLLLERMNDPRGVYARLPAEMEISH